MAKTYEELLEQAAIIRDETAAGKNTATRVGGTITDAVDYVKELQDTYAGIHAEAAEAKESAAAAKTTAEQANRSATNAFDNSRSAVLTANAANSTANAANSTATAAKTESAQAVSTAQEAKEAADGIVATVQDAKDTADAANTAATEAKATAEQANRSATNAFDNARSALLTANAAKATADGIAATAQEAKDTADAAKQTADGIAATANEAKATAQAAKDTADAAKAEIVENVGTLNEEDIRLNGLIAANTAKITSVESTATQARDMASSANEEAAAAQTKNTEQDARLENIEARIDPDIAGRVWNEDNGTPKAESYYGSVKALRDLPKRLGLGRYIVKDDRTRRKLDPNDSTKYIDGSTAKLDGTDGQCMWCWNGFYANIWHEGSRLIKAVTFDRPVGDDISIWIPAGGISWLGAGVIDRGDAPYTDKTKWKLCSVINNSEQFRGGGGTALDASKYTKAPADTTPQITMLGMPATNISTTDFGTYARNRGDGKGWEANWFVARFVVEFLFEVIMGTENSQEAFNANKDANGLYQGGFGTGVTESIYWTDYNGQYPVIPTNVGLEAGDGVCLVPYSLPNTGGAEGTYRTFNVPVFFGLVGAGYGNLWQSVRGVTIDIYEEPFKVYVSKSMYSSYDQSAVEDKIMVAEYPRVSGYITRKSYRGLCCMPTKVGGSFTTRYADISYAENYSQWGRNLRLTGGSLDTNSDAGASCTFPYGINAKGSHVTSPLCYFTEDPIIPDSQSIANNS